MQTTATANAFWGICPPSSGSPFNQFMSGSAG